VVDLCALSVVEDAPRRLPREEHREVQQVEAEEVDRKAELSESFGVHLPGDLGPPVVETAEQCSDTGDHHVVEVRDDPVGPAELVVENDRTEEDAGDPAEDEQHERTQRE